MHLQHASALAIHNVSKRCCMITMLKNSPKEESYVAIANTNKKDTISILKTPYALPPSANDELAVHSHFETIVFPDPSPLASRSIQPRKCFRSFVAWNFLTLWNKARQSCLIQSGVHEALQNQAQEEGSSIRASRPSGWYSIESALIRLHFKRSHCIPLHQEGCHKQLLLIVWQSIQETLHSFYPLKTSMCTCGTWSKQHSQCSPKRFTLQVC